MIKIMMAHKMMLVGTAWSNPDQNFISTLGAEGG